MTAQPDRPITIQVSPQQAELLAGLEAWLRLGLLSDAQVRQLCQEHLTCALPEPIPHPQDSEPSANAPPAPAFATIATPPAGDGETDFADATPSLPPSRQPPRRSRRPARDRSHVGQLLQAFMAEISVIWLLFLGVFLVVVSSGVLAASQWRNFPAVGQYGILLVYTLAFFVTGIWTGRQPSLRLTAQMLQIATLLIIPVNFWMIDGLKLWQSGIGALVGVFAALALSGATLVLLRQRPALTQEAHPSLTAINILGLSWLHWGWAIPRLPLIATYIGTIGTAWLLFIQFRSGSASPSSPAPSRWLSRSPATIAITLSTLLLMGRAVWLAQVPVHQLGLALGICGWLLVWLNRRTQNENDPRLQRIWSPIGIILLLLGWVVSVSTDPPWQAIVVSGLALWLLVEHLQTTGRSGSLVALFLVGLQAYVLLWRIFPVEVRQGVIDVATRIAGEVAIPESLLGIAVFPYLWLTMATATWLRSRSSQSPFVASFLAKQTETIAFILGMGMSVVSLANPAVRSLNLLLSACTLGWIVWKRPLGHVGLIYLTHILAIVAILSGIDWQYPTLSDLAWARILLGLMVAEWGLSIGANYANWRRSAWYIGLALAGLSYTVLLSFVLAEGGQPLIWLITPVLLTGLSRIRQFAEPRLAAWLSTAALCAQLVLLGSLNDWIISLAIATGLMLVNTYTVQRLGAAGLTIGFALGFESTLIWREFSEQWRFEEFLIILAVTLWGLWLLQGWLVRQSTPLRQIYAAAANGWGIALSALALLSLALHAAIIYSFETDRWHGLWAAGLTVGAIAYRLWQTPTNSVFFSLACGVEIFAAIGIALVNGDIEDLAIVTLGFGLMSQIGGDGWVRKSGQPYWVSWHVIPLLYAGFGFLLAHTQFTALTGLYSLAAALTSIGVGRRFATFKPLTVLGILLTSFAAYELLIYQLMQVQSGNLGDGIALLAGIAALIAWSDRLFAPWLLPYLRLIPDELKFIAHLHWLLGSGLALLATITRLNPASTVLLIGTAIALSTYALSLGRETATTQESQESQEPAEQEPAENESSGDRFVHFTQIAWTYAGIAELLLTIGYGLYEAIADTTLLIQWAGAIAAVLAWGMCVLPWQRWGWSIRPWQNLAAVLPMGVVLLTSWETVLQSLLIAAAFYAWFAKATNHIRLSYLSILLLDWAILRFVNLQDWLNALWFGGVLGGSLLYVAQVEPTLQAQSAKEQRHWLRSLATGLVCLTALYQAEVETGATAIVVGLITLGFSIGLIFAGLLLRIRAFLYVGTITFVLRILRWLWLFINTDALLLWSVGIVLGLMFIWIAATFEARRSQVSALVQYWSTELEGWE